MKLKKSFAILGAGMFAAACLSLYLMLESTGSGMVGKDPRQLNAVDFKIQKIENDIKQNERVISKIKETIKGLYAIENPKFKAIENQIKENIKPGNTERILNVGSLSKDVISVPIDICKLCEEPAPKVDIQMMDVFDTLPFDNPDGGVWKQGFPLTPDLSRYSSEKPLKVFVVPHSHNDPGWIKTFEKYYSDQTRQILNLMIDKLEVDKRRKFIFAEMSYFWLWWGEIDDNKRQRTLSLIHSGQLELVTAGWVMNDEANTHYAAMVDQMIEGNEYLNNQLGIKPRSGWAIDPFGHTPTMAYLLKKMGFENMLIQRIHYAIKKHLGKSKNLEFTWRQNWDHTGSTDMFCHMMPFYSYDVPHTCGPDPKICCQFDFKRLPGGRVTCPWKIPPVPITDSNVAQKAETLLDQYRKKAELYRNNVLFVPLGDDFRYDKAVEWDQQFGNYQRLFDYMNGQSSWHVQAQFGTLSDYFDAVRERSGTKELENPVGYPVLSGDFFTYSDREDHYWSGYYTSRPFYKNLDRVLESNLRTAEILYSLAIYHARHLKSDKFPMQNLMQILIPARRNLGLYQHHDGITGTAKDVVVADYGIKMLNALKDLKKIICQSALFLLTANKEQYQYNDASPYFDVDEVRASHDSLPERTVIKLTSEPKPVALFNSLGQSRKELVRLYVTSENVEIKDADDKVLSSQTDLYWTSNEESAYNVFKVHFVAELPALGLVTYTVREAENPNNVHSKVTMYNSKSSGDGERGKFKISHKSPEDFSIENNELKAEFSSATGLLSAMEQDGMKTQTIMEFVKYGTRNGKDKSGAYLFLPDGEAKILPYSNPFTRVIDGPLLSEVHVFLPKIEHVVRLPKSPGVDSLALEVYNIVNIMGESNFEIAMRIRSALQNKDNEFYTDLNGFQMQRRKTMSKLPLQANFYPMPAMTYLQDDSTRLGILSQQSLGVASLQKGWIEIMMDRTLSQDDNRGLFQGVKDNKRTPNKFRILLERRGLSAKIPPTLNVGFPSLLAHTLSLQLIHRIHVIPKNINSGATTDLLPTFKGLNKELPCELHLLNLRTMQNKEINSELKHMPKDSAALLLHRLGIDCSFPVRGLQCTVSNGKISLENMFKDLLIEKVIETSLSLQHDNTEELKAPYEVTIPSMEINTYKINLQ